jgi:hypothetical protein
MAKRGKEAGAVLGPRTSGQQRSVTVPNGQSIRQLDSRIGHDEAWTRTPIAQLRYDTAAGTWTLYWADRNRRWHRSDDLDPTPQLDDLLKEIDEDPLSIFWG